MNIDQQETKVSYWWILFLIVLLVLAAGLFLGAYLINKKRRDENPPIPFHEEEPPREEKKEPIIEVKPEPAVDEKDKPKAEATGEAYKRGLVGFEDQRSEPEDAEQKEEFAANEYQCTRKHNLKWSNDEEGYKDGTFICKRCKKEGYCNAGRYTCDECREDYCPICLPPPEEEPAK